VFQFTPRPIVQSSRHTGHLRDTEAVCAAQLTHWRTPQTAVLAENSICPSG
jgi:hypothetical protein